MVDHFVEDPHRAIAERLLLGALREQEMTRTARDDAMRARFLASVSRDLAQSLDESAAEAAVARVTLPRDGSWCIVDVIQPDGGGALRRLEIAHPPPRRGGKQADARAYVERRVGRTLVVPLVVRGSAIGTITFVAPKSDPAFSADEHRLASDIADLCALALDNARLYREANVLRQFADEANRANSTFLGRMTHELMTPLNAIGGYVSLLEMGLRGPLTPEQLVDLSRIRVNQAHLLTLISEVLAQVRSDRGRLQYRFSEVSVQATLREVVSMLQSAVDERHLTLAFLFESADEIVWADAVRLRQIVLNLVMNAIKYGTAPGGAITIESSATSVSVAIHVTDNGPGIPEAELEAIFDPFVQLPNGLTDRRGGVGLGLAISRDLARAMNGDLTVSSTLGAGSRFTLELPRP